MTRELMTQERRAEHATALMAARVAGVRADAILELKGILQPYDYTPVVITTSSTIAVDAVDPDIVVELSGDTFEVGIDTVDVEVSVGTTSLTVASVTRDGAGQITIGMSGTATAGTLTVKVLASGLVNTPYCPTNTLTITVA